jgi:hypothetical protein
MTKHSLASVLALSFCVMYAEEAPALTLSNRSFAISNTNTKIFRKTHLEKKRTSGKQTGRLGMYTLSF